MGSTDTRRRLLVVLAVGVLFALSVVMATSSLAKPGGSQAADNGVYAVAEQIGPTPSAAPQAQEGSRSAAAASQCKSIGARVSYYNGSGKLLAYFQSVQKWCFDFNKVTSVSKPQVADEVTALGEKSDWKYKGLVESSGELRAYKGRPDGQHIGIRQGRFTYEGSNGKGEKLPFVKLVKYYDGSAYSDTKESNAR